MILIHSKIGQGMRNHFEKLVNWYGIEATHSCLSRKQHFQPPLEPRSEIDKDQQCERCGSLLYEELSAVRKR